MEKYKYIFIGSDPGHLSPEALLAGGKTSKESKKSFADRLFTESKEIVGGIFVVSAKTWMKPFVLQKTVLLTDLMDSVEFGRFRNFDM